MRPVYGSSELKQLAENVKYKTSWDTAIVKLYRKRIQQIVAAPDQRALRAFRSLRLEKLKGQRSGQYSLRLNDQWRLIVVFGEEAGEKVVHIVGIEDYHS